MKDQPTTSYDSLEKWCYDNGSFLLKEWDYEKNAPLLPSTIKPRSNKCVWWKCRYNHEWKMSPNHRIGGSNCPYCAGKRIMMGFNDLLTTNPELAKEWHPTKNGNLKSTDISKGSKKKVWWLGKCGHEWEAPVYSRSSGKDCPVCYGRKVLVGFNDLQTVNPELAKEWHPVKNGALKPTDVVGASNKKVWWMCNKGHEWQAPINSRKRGNGCRICAGQTAVKGSNDLKSQRPDIIDDWDYEKNKLLPDEIAIQSNKQVWWKCKICGYSWKAAPYARIRSSCPKCANECHTSFGEEAIAFYLSQIVPIKERFHDKILGKMELDIFIPSMKTAVEYDGRYYHNNPKKDLRKNEICKKNDIELIRFRECGCPPIDSFIIEIDPLDRGTLTKGINDLIQHLKTKYNFDKEVAVDVERDSLKIIERKYSSKKEYSLSSRYPELAKEYHPSKNGILKPEYVPAQSNEKVWWVCTKGHEWQAEVSSRARGDGCPYCSGKRVLPGYNDMQTLFPDLSTEWHTSLNGDLKPSEVTPGSHKIVWWIGKCGHQWQTQVYHRASGHGCPFCSGRSILVGFNDLKSINPKLASEWHPTKNGVLTPSDVTLHSNKKVWWQCTNGHEWETSINHRSSGTGCPFCSKVVK